MIPIRTIVPVILASVVWLSGASAGERGPASPPAAAGKPRLFVLLDDAACRMALEIAGKDPQALVYVQLTKGQDLAAARRAVEQAGLYGRRVFVEAGPPTRVGLADNLADMVMVMDPGRPGRLEGEVRRVLRPGGVGAMGGRLVVKDAQPGVDDWSHVYHGPDNNPQSKDTVARSPYLTQFVAAPRYGPAPQAAVAAGGRLFVAFGHIAWHQREEAMLNTLVAVNGYNGSILWRRPLPEGFMVDRNLMIATDRRLYLGDPAGCKVFDAARGDLLDEFVAPPQAAAGETFWKWMALEGGVLYGLIGAAEKPDEVARWKSEGHGWPWGGMSRGYNAQEHPWGFGQTLVAFDAATKKLLWSRREDKPIDSRGLVLRNGRIYFCIFGDRLVALDAGTGSDLWRRTADRDAELFKAIGAYRPGQGWVGGWRTGVFLKASDDALYFVGPQVPHVTAVSTDRGRWLWKHPFMDLQMVIRPEGPWVTGPEGSRSRTMQLSPGTGEGSRVFDVARRACTRTTGSVDGLFFRAFEGTVRLDTATGKPQYISPMRPSCHVGVLIAHGQLYWVPWACDCNLQMFGLISVASAGDFDFAAKPLERDRLQTYPAPAPALQPAPNDWPAYRADNARSAKTAAALPAAVKPLWTSAPQTPFEPTAPTAAGGLVFLAGDDGIVRALDAATGRPRWQGYTGGTVLYPPAISAGRAFVGSADGYAYAFDAATGALAWRFRAAPIERKIPVYDRLQSTWPVAAGVLVEHGAAYLAAGMNNFDGTHLFALDADTGRIRWHNGSSGHLDAFSRRGVGVQGDLLVAGGKLHLAGGNVAGAACFDLATGACSTPAPGTPGSQAPRGRELSFDGKTVSVSGQPLYSRDDSPVYDGATHWRPAIVQAPNGTLRFVQEKDKRWSLSAQPLPAGPELWRVPLPAPPVRWGLAVDAAGRIFVTLRDGTVVCLGAK